VHKKEMLPVKVDVGGREFEVDDQGDGPSVVLLGWRDSHRLRRDQLPALHEAGFRQ